VSRLAAVSRLVRRGLPAVGSTPADVVHRENKLSLLRYKARPSGLAFSTPVVLVPSLINRHYVLDLMPGKSFVEWLVARGHDVYCIDWGTPSDEDRWIDLDTIFDRYVHHAVRAAARTSGVEKVHTLGYCMGGLMTLVHATLHPHEVASTTTLATPVRFEGDDGSLLGAWTSSPTFDVQALVQGSGVVPWQLLQSAFQMLRPTMNLSKAVHFIDKMEDDPFVDGFLALETWGNDNVGLPGAFYEQYLRDFYRGDKLARGELVISGRKVDLGSLAMPLHCVSFQHDSIVPAASAQELVSLAGSADKVGTHLPGGHVGAVVAKSAAERLWPKLATFWEQRDGARA
jgi:polyhydroxyalkanoate synthase